MGQTLTNGIYLPAEGEVRCYDGLASNWTTLDAVVGGYRAHVANENIHITSEERNKWDTGVTQAYVLRYASVSLTALGTVAFSGLDNTDNIKIGDKVLDSEGKLFALTAVDSENSSATLSALLIDLSKDSDLSNYYTKNETDTLLNDKADDLDVLHKTGNETVNGIKNFKDLIPIDGDYLGDEASTNQRTNICLRANRDTANKSCAYISRFRQNKSQGALQTSDLQIIGFDVLENEVRTNNVFSIQCSGWVDNVPTKVKLVSTGSYSSFGSSAKPSKINDINPGSLSLPNLSAGVDISGYLTNAGTTTPSEYTPLVNGWIVLKISADSPAFIRAYSDGGLDVSSYSERNEIGSTSGGSYTCFASLLVPCIKNDKLNIILMPGTMTIISAKFYPCLGNV